MSIELPTFKTVISNLCVPSLEDLSMLSIVTYLLEQDNIIKILNEHLSAQRPSPTLPNGRISRIINTCKSVQIPHVVESKFINAIHWVLDLFMEWIFKVVDNQLLSRYCSKKEYAKQVINAVKWDSNFTVKHQASISQLLKNLDTKANLGVFKIVCEFCSEDDVRMLWSELSAASRKKIFDCEDFNSKYGFQLYWACVMTGNMEKFLEFFCKFVNIKGGDYSEVIEFKDSILENANDCGFVMAVLEKNFAGVKYFSRKLTKIDDECLVYVIEKFLGIIKGSLGWLYRNENVDLLYFLLNKITDEELQKRILDNHFMMFLRLSGKYWPCHKYIIPLVKMNQDKLNDELLFHLMTDLLSDVQRQRADIVLVKNLWRNVSVDLKKSFFSLICIETGKRNARKLWENVTIDILDMFLKEEEFLRVSPLNENKGLIEFIQAQKFDVVDYWIKKWLMSEQEIINFMEDHIIGQSVTIINKNSLSKANQFLDWAFKNEDVMNMDKVLGVKDEVAEKVCVEAFIKTIKSSTANKWNDLNKFLDWLIKNRNDYDDKLISLKKKLFDNMKILFQGKDFYTVSHFKKFLSYGISNTDKVKDMINEIDFHENENCSKWLSKCDWNSVILLLDFLSEYGRDILKIKQNILDHIFTTGDDIFFNDEKYYESIDYVLYWSSKKGTKFDSKKVKMDVWEIKKSIIKKLACKSIVKLVQDGINIKTSINVLKFLFKEKDEDKNYAVIVTELKRAVVREIIPSDFVCQNEYFLSDVVPILNWGKDDEKLKNEIWSVKKYFLEVFKNHVKPNLILELTLKLKKFFIPLFEGHEHYEDFKEILWDLKEFMLLKIVNNCEAKSIKQLFEEFKDFLKFLNWNGFSEIKLEEIKNIIFEKHGLNCCLQWISKDDFVIIKDFLYWCIENDSDKQLKIIKFKKNVLKDFILEQSELFWCRENFLALDKFLTKIMCTDTEKDLKKQAIEEFGAKGCSKQFLENKLSDIENFIEWAHDGNVNFVDD